MVVNWEKLMNRRSFMRPILSAFVVDTGQKKNLLTGSKGIFRKFYSKLLFIRYSHVIFTYLLANVDLIDKFLRLL